MAVRNKESKREIGALDPAHFVNKFSFNFSGAIIASIGYIAEVSGDWSASDPETGVELLFTTGDAFVFPSDHQLLVGGQCVITTPDGRSLPGFCDMYAIDETSTGATDHIEFEALSANGAITANGQLASGNIIID